MENTEINLFQTVSKDAHNISLGNIEGTSLITILSHCQLSVSVDINVRYEVQSKAN
jgi:hypothetical protein